MFRNWNFLYSTDFLRRTQNLKKISKLIWIGMFLQIFVASLEDLNFSKWNKILSNPLMCYRGLSKPPLFPHRKIFQLYWAIYCKIFNVLKKILQLRISKYSDLPDNRAVNLIIFWNFFPKRFFFLNNWKKNPPKMKKEFLCTQLLGPT